MLSKILDMRSPGVAQIVQPPQRRKLQTSRLWAERKGPVLRPLKGATGLSCHPGLSRRTALAALAGGRTVLPALVYNELDRPTRPPPVAVIA